MYTMFRTWCQTSLGLDTLRSPFAFDNIGANNTYQSLLTPNTPLHGQVYIAVKNQCGSCTYRPEDIAKKSFTRFGAKTSQ